MKNIAFYSDVLDFETEDEVFDFIISNLKPSTMRWSYFVNWKKVFENTKQIEVALNCLNYLIGKENFDEEFRYLLRENPNLAKFLPALVVRSGPSRKKFKVLVDFNNHKLVYENFDFSKDTISGSDIESYLTFVKETGLKDLLVGKKIKNLVDYMIGVEAGLDSNARKNRSGNAMEEIVEVFIREACVPAEFRYLKEANEAQIKQEFGYDVPMGKSPNRYDFAVDNGSELFLIETNFYGGGGSKLASTAGQYRNRFDSLNGKHNFLWITDGEGWRNTVAPLRESFHHNEYIFSLAMLERGALNYLFGDINRG